MRPRVRVGRLTIWLWSGSWSWWFDTEDCDHCRNLYVGPFGVEWTRDIPPGVPRDRAPRNYAEQRALLEDSLRDIPRGAGYDDG